MNLMSVKEGDTAAKERVNAAFHRDEEVLKRFLMRALGSKEDTEDVMQEVWVRLLQRERESATKEYPRAYLFVTATNIIRDRRRRDRVRRHADNDPIIRDPTEIDPIDRRPSAETTVIWREGLEIVKKALAETNPLYAEIFVMHWGEGMTISEISIQKGISIRSVERYASHALSHCKRALEKRKW